MDARLASVEEGALSGGTLITIAADREVSTLGFSPTGVPPDAVVVSQVLQESLAARNGVAVGDTLLTIGERSSSEMTKAEIEEGLAQRPVRLTFLRTASVAKPKVDLESEAIASLAKISAAKRALSAACSEAASLRTSIRPDANGLSEEACEALTALAIVSQEDSLASDNASEDEDQLDTEWPAEEDLPFTVVATVDVNSLGFSVVGLPPSIVSVAEMIEDGWAECQGIEKEDILLMLDGKLTSDLTKKEMTKKMKKRPLELTFLREYDEGLPAPPPHLVVQAVQTLGRVMTGEDA